MAGAAARLVVALRWVIVPAWIAAAVLATTSLASFTGQQQSGVEGVVRTNGEAALAERRSARLFGAPLLSRVMVVQRNPRGLPRAAYRRAAKRAVQIAEGRAPVLRSIAFALPVTNAAGAFPGSRERGTTIVTFLYFRPSVGTGAQTALANTYADRVRAGGDPVVGTTGTVVARNEELTAIRDALPLLEAATVALVLLILLAVFRAPGPPLITLGCAGLSYLLSTRLLTQLADSIHVQVPRELEPVLVALVLGLTTDYTVFLFSGARQRILAGEHVRPAVRTTARATLPIVVTAGLIVAAGSASLALGKLGLFRALGPGMAVTVLVTLAIATTLTPAIMAIFGRALFWPGLSGRGGTEDAEPEPRPSPLRRLSVRRPVAIVTAAAVVAALGLAASQARGVELGLPIIRGIDSGDPTKRAATAAAKGFQPGIIAPTEVLVESRGGRLARSELGRLQRLLARERDVGGVVGVADQPRRIRRPVFVTSDRHAARYVLFFRSDPLGAEAVHRLDDLRGDLPRLLARAGIAGARASVAGDTALVAEAVRTTRGDIVLVAVALLLANFVLLALLLRALVAPLYLLFTSALGLASALGLTVWFFQDALGYEELTYYVPFAAAVLLLSLGSDYNIFLAGRIWHMAERRTLREALTVATPRAAGTIAVAAVTLAGSFALLGLVRVRSMSEFAFMMTAGILVDSFVIRSVLVPAVVAAFGGLSWWPRRGPRYSGSASSAATSSRSVTIDSLPSGPRGHSSRGRSR